MIETHRIQDTLPRSVLWQDDGLYLLDQTRLPHDIVIEHQLSAEQLWHSIRELKVRGAPAIGVAAAYGLCLSVQTYRSAPLEEFHRELQKQAGYLDSARPTAVNLGWALRRLLKLAKTSHAPSSEQLYQQLLAEAISIHEEDRQLCTAIGLSGLELITEGCGVLTHCNAGALATTGIGTATAPMYLAHESGRQFQVYANETRPLLQGARLTAWELQTVGLDVHLITDNMTAHIMASGAVDLVIVGTDRVAANGDVANKIGTLGVAIMAKHFQIPFYVACPASTIDLETATGAAIPIEERAPSEVRGFGSYQSAAEQTQVKNPAFDITPHELVTGLITERGILAPPFSTSLLQP